MASNKVSTGKALTELVNKYFDEYGAEVYAALDDVLPEMGKEIRAKLKSESPKRTGAYSKNWRFRNETKGRYYVGCVVYNDPPTYRLAHLLEYGHAKRGGGRVEGKAHIAPVEEWANEEVVRRVEERLGKA